MIYSTNSYELRELWNWNSNCYSWELEQLLRNSRNSTGTVIITPELLELHGTPDLNENQKLNV